MKLVARKQRILALIMGIAVLATLIFQIIRDGHRLEMKRVTDFQSTTK